jgi:hypothetical protein
MKAASPKERAAQIDRQRFAIDLMRSIIADHEKHSALESLANVEWLQGRLGGMRFAISLLDPTGPEAKAEEAAHSALRKSLDAAKGGAA